MRLKIFTRGNDKREQLYNEHASYLMGVCMRYSSSKDEAEDILHDVFIKIFGSIDKIDWDGNVRSYLHGMTKNHIIDVFRRKKLLFDNVIDISTVSDDEFNPDDYDTDVYNIIKAMQQLSERERFIFNMHIVDGYLLREIAEILNIPINTAKVLSWKAKNKLKDILLKKPIANEQTRMGQSAQVVS